MAGHPFSNYEKNFLLAEIIKAGSQDPTFLLGLINQHSLQPQNWNDVILPPGRTVNQCYAAYEELRRTQPPMMRTASFAQTPSPLSASVPMNLKRPFPFDASFPTGREIRPKPSSAAGYHGQISAIDHPPKKKRGRPTKAEAQAKADAQSAGAGPATPAAEGIAPPMPAAPTIPPPPEPPAPVYSPPSAEIQQAPIIYQPPQELGRSGLPPTARVPISSFLTPNVPASTSQSSSSSGKRRRGRSNRSDPDETALAEAESSRDTELYRSPYARMGPRSPETPARPATSRGDDEEREGGDVRQRDSPESGAAAPAQASPEQPGDSKSSVP